VYLLLSTPLSSEGDDFSSVLNLVEGDVLLEQPPHISEVWGGLNVDD
jgi:hypothetical protein